MVLYWGYVTFFLIRDLSQHTKRGNFHFDQIWNNENRGNYPINDFILQSVWFHVHKSFQIIRCNEFHIVEILTGTMIILPSYIYHITPQDALCEKIFLCRHTSIFLLPESTKLGFSCLMSTMGESLIVIHYKFRIWIYVTFHSFATNPKILLQPKSFSCCIRHAFE